MGGISLPIEHLEENLIIWSERTIQSSTQHTHYNLYEHWQLFRQTHLNESEVK